MQGKLIPHTNWLRITPAALIKVCNQQPPPSRSDCNLLTSMHRRIIGSNHAAPVIVYSYSQHPARCSCKLLMTDANIRKESIGCPTTCLPNLSVRCTVDCHVCCSTNSEAMGSKPVALYAGKF